MKTFLPLLALCLAAPAFAGKLALRPGMTGVPDLGVLRCETFTTIFPAGPTGFRQSLLTWAAGYVYARSGQTLDAVLESQPDGGAAWTFDSLTDVMIDFCAGQPEAQLPDAVAALWARLQPPAVSTGPQ